MEQVQRLREKYAVDSPLCIRENVDYGFARSDRRLPVELSLLDVVGYEYL